MRIHRDESGQVLALTGFCMVVLLGFLALALDVGMLFRAKRNIQIAADAAAIAAATYERYHPTGGGPSSITGAANEAATQNGITNGVNGAVVTVVTPPVDGSVTSTGFIEVTISQPESTYFMGILTHSSSMTVAARAVAGVPAVGSNCIYITGDAGTVPNQNDALYLQGADTINAPNCGIYVNSISPTALAITGGDSHVTAASFNVYGGTPSKSTTPTAPVANAPAESDPLGDITGPTLAACQGSNTVTAGATAATAVTAANLTAAPPLAGVVCFSTANAILSANLNLPGASGAGIVYLFENGVTVNAPVQFGTGNCSGTPPTCTTTTGATMDLYGGSLNQGSNVALSIFAPTAGNTYNGVAILQPQTNTNMLTVQWGSNGQTMDGYIYAPGAEVYLQDHGGGITASGIVAGTMYVKSSTINIPSYNRANESTTPFRAVTLVE